MKMMKYFKSSDPDDMSHGDLSKRVRLLKREQGGYKTMSEVSEKLINWGIEQGGCTGRNEQLKKAGE